MNLSQRQKLIAAASAVALAIGVGVALRPGDDYDPPISAALEDAGTSRTTGTTRTTDLLTVPVDPGVSITTGVTLPRGARVTDIAPGDGFTVGAQTHTDHRDGTWYEVTVTRTGDAPARFVGYISFTLSADGGL